MSKEVFIVTIGAVAYALMFAILNKNVSAIIAWVGAGGYCWMCYDCSKENEKLINKLKEASDFIEKLENR